MLQSLFRRAEATVDNAIAAALARALIAVPFLVAAGFATAGIALYLYEEFGSTAGNLVMAAVFAVVGLVTAAVVTARLATDTPAHVSANADTSSADQSEDKVAGLDPMDREVLSAALAAVGPLAAPLVLRSVVRNLPLVAAIAAAGFILTRPSASDATPPPMQAAE